MVLNIIVLIAPFCSGQIVSTYAGRGTFAYNDGETTLASFYYPNGLSVDMFGNLYVADSYNHRIRKINSSGYVSTVAGSVQGYADGQGVNSQFNYPAGVTVNSLGDLYVADQYNNVIRKVNASGYVSSVAGNSVGAYADGQGNMSSFYHPARLAFDSAGSILVADQDNNLIRRINTTGYVSTFAGSGLKAYNDGSALIASFSAPASIFVDQLNNAYIADYGNNLIRKINSAGNVTTIAGNSLASFADGLGTAASFNCPNDAIVDSLGNIFVIDMYNYRVRKIDSFGYVTSFAGKSAAGYKDGFGADAAFSRPSGICMDAEENLYVSDLKNNRIRKIIILSTTSSISATIITASVTTISTVNSEFSTTSRNYIPTNALINSTLVNLRINY